MAINMKDILADGLLHICQTVSLEKITIKQLLDETNVSRQTFYNHFQDKNDLIQYIYLSKIIPLYSTSDHMIDFHTSLLDTLYRIKKYHKFMKEACLISGQNCLKDYIFEHCKQFDLEWHQKLYGSTPMPDALRFATEYHATASSSMTLSWILSDMPASCEEMADLITQLRGFGMQKLFNHDESKGNPYTKMN